MDEVANDDKLELTAPMFQYHAVLLYDLLGQSTKLRRITAIPETLEEEKSVTGILSETAGAVLRMRRHMKRYYDKVIVSQIDAHTLPPEARPQFERTRAVELTIRSFSDLTVAHTPLMEAPGAKLPMASVAALISSAASMMLISLVGGTPIRGAIDVGLAIDLEGSEIYGPILDRVYCDESQVAEWPRILVGDGLKEYLIAASHDPGNGLESSSRRDLAHLCTEFNETDIDGRTIVDYLGSGAKRRMGSNVPFALIEKALTFVNNEFLTYKEQKNDKLAARYEKVLEYGEARKEVWR